MYYLLSEEFLQNFIGVSNCTFEENTVVFPPRFLRLLFWNNGFEVQRCIYRIIYHFLIFIHEGFPVTDCVGSCECS